jgi:hypothetical protein
MSMIEETFKGAMVDIYTRAVAECDYRPTRFLHTIEERGAVATAKALLHAPKASDGFATLWERGRLDLSVEALVLQNRWRPLFTDDERAIARKRLHQVGYKPK